MATTHRLVNYAAKIQYANYLGTLDVLVDLVEGDIHSAVHGIPEDYAPKGRIWMVPERTEIVKAYQKVEGTLQTLCKVTKNYERLLIARDWKV